MRTRPEPNPAANLEPLDASWKSLCRVGGAAALAAGILFRRNIAAEIGLLSTPPPPTTVGEWFALLQSNRLLALAYLNVLDLVNYALVALVLLALYAALRRTARSVMTIAAAAGLLGVAVYLSSNTALSMLALGEQYAAATAESQQAALLAAGQALLALNRFGAAGSHPGTAGYISLFFVAAAGLLISLVMLRSALFNRATAYVGILAGGLDLAYCLAFALVPVDGELLALLFIPAAGLFWMLWHVLVGWRLCRLGRPEGKKPPSQS